MARPHETPLRGELRLNEPLAGYTSWRVGGPARRLYKPADRDDLIAFMKQRDPGEPLLWIGLGSNLLVRDGGFEGTVIVTQGLLDHLSLDRDGALSAEAGVTCARVARAAARYGLCGVEFLAGIPGTLGGALAMNTGAFGGETWEHVFEVETLDRSGAVHRRARDEFAVGYRRVKGPDGEWFLAARFRLEPGDTGEAQASIRRLLDRRSLSQPIGLPSCGSVFRNPEGGFAARLIEAAGLKGTCIGGACVSEKHANFIINTGGASAGEIESLIERIRDEVIRTSGVALETEVHIVGRRERCT